MVINPLEKIYKMLLTLEEPIIKGFVEVNLSGEQGSSKANIEGPTTKGLFNMSKKLNIASINKLVENSKKVEKVIIKIDEVDYEFNIKKNLLNSDIKEFKRLFLEFPFAYMQTDAYTTLSEFEQGAVLENYVIGLTIKTLTDLDMPDDIDGIAKVLENLSDMNIINQIMESIDESLLDELNEAVSDMLNNLQSLSEDGAKRLEIEENTENNIKE